MKIGDREWKQLIAGGARRFDIALKEATVERFAIHARELLKWNRKINLTAITDPLEVAVKHYLDAIAPIRFLPQSACLLDIGSGGGFPGIPLKIAMPQLPVTLIDASRKKVAFLTHTGRQLGLDRFQALHIRAEDLARRRLQRHIRQAAGDKNAIEGFCESFDLIVTRALGSLDEFVALGLPVLSEAGAMVAYKGAVSEQEIAFDRFSAAGLSVFVHRYELPYIKSKRSLVILRKRSGEPDRIAV